MPLFTSPPPKSRIGRGLVTRATGSSPERLTRSSAEDDDTRPVPHRSSARGERRIHPSTDILRFLCISLSEKLSKVLVIEGSPADKELLQDEGISEADAFLAVTDKEEVNILTSLITSQLGAKKSIALVDRPGLKSILEEIGLDLVISPRSVTLSPCTRGSRWEV